jgi:hypothetical protein
MAAAVRCMEVTTSYIQFRNCCSTVLFAESCLGHIVIHTTCSRSTSSNLSFVNARFSECLIPLILAQVVVLGTTTVKLGKAIGAATKLASQTQACLAPTTEITLAVVVEAAMAEVAVVAWGAPKSLSFSSSPPNSSSIHHRQGGTNAALFSRRKPMACFTISPQHKTKLPKLHRN